MDGVTSSITQVVSDDAVYEYRADRWWGESATGVRGLQPEPDHLAGRRPSRPNQRQLRDDRPA